ncbi:glycoside hydrolase family 43 protein [Telmatospirillum sp.]|uniref:glycoside hydrolase family 43 protein n=1 Tax=Telmatospirillum sp. TaxID=2079197 RepID=UPI00284808C0|nr:glycoside hydrolase family 43 protein [Telmatospirillum sp.]MDR3438767.1 glycoside hydrolase family 43 protein [Telmatospirillum sp.]
MSANLKPVIVNPILPGFNPDPSIVRVGGDYYIATSTFEWYPGVQIHHSRDLVNWRLLSRPLNRASQLDMRGEADSCGVWAPCLTYSDGLFWLAYSDVKRRQGAFKDVHNYLVTASSIEGPWSDPVYLNSSGFDPSLFHDEDGRRWLVNVAWDHRGKPSRFGGIVLQEYDVAARRLTGPITNIFKGSQIGLTEGPHLYRHGGYYHLITAEGGTGYGHAVTQARSRTLTGPYELHPDVHIVTARITPDCPLQRAGHGDFVETEAGETYLVHLTGRSRNGGRRSPLGRETAIQKVIWHQDGWLRLAGEKQVPKVEVEAPGLPPCPFPPEPECVTFDGPNLHIAFQWLRTPDPKRIFSLAERPGCLRLIGRESIGSWHEQALVARRQTAFSYDAETEIDANPASYRQMAGLVTYYNRFAYHYLALTFDETIGRCLQILSCNGAWPLGTLTLGLDAPVPIPATGTVRMRVEVRGASLQFFYSVEDSAWIKVGGILDASFLSDECGEGEHGNFTGAFVGMAANDLGGLAMPADFFHFTYRTLDV